MSKKLIKARKARKRTTPRKKARRVAAMSTPTIDAGAPKNYLIEEHPEF